MDNKIQVVEQLLHYPKYTAEGRLSHQKAKSLGRLWSICCPKQQILYVFNFSF